MEGIALAREEKRPRQYQSDSAVQLAYIAAATGGGAGSDEDAEAGEGTENPGDPSSGVKEHFQAIPDCGIVGEEEWRGG